MVEDEGEVAGITTVCGTPSEMAGVGRSTRAGGDARRRRGVRPSHGEIDQLDGEVIAEPAVEFLLDVNNLFF